MTVLSLILILVVLPAVIGYCLYMEYTSDGFDSSPSHPGHFWRRLFRHQLEPGDYLIYRKSKASPRPGPRARNVQASEKGDDYYYDVDKFWTVSDVLDDGRLIAVTRTGKRVCLTPEDERVRKAGLLDWMRYRRRFPQAGSERVFAP